MPPLLRNLLRLAGFAVVNFDLRLGVADVQEQERRRHSNPALFALDAPVQPGRTREFLARVEGELDGSIGLAGRSVHQDIIRDSVDGVFFKRPAITVGAHVHDVERRSGDGNRAVE